MPDDARIVCIGGGHGLSAALSAAKQLTPDVTAVVTGADDGGSSGVLRRWLGIPAPGDLRMAIAALAGEDQAALMQYRFSEGDLAGHPLGNLLIAALADVRGDFVRAVAEAARIAGVTGAVYPASPDPLTLHATIGGNAVEGQVAIALGPDAVERLWLDPAEPPATPEAVEAIERADLVVLGPGSLFTSILAALIVPGIGRAVRNARRVAFVLNLSEQLGETKGMSAAAHIDAMTGHVRRLRLDVVLVHEGPSGGMRRPVHLDEQSIRVPIVKADLVSDGVHDPLKLAATFKTLL
ncbi:MAG TPA: uridine diphosphate-N-acetylglucosamine-binding protein YvcK [Actinomycetota bacterium]|nr:uridine diphosphate-N-acetylglucosamine-binding protein YvcK [Actinomycetota bacterium]